MFGQWCICRGLTMCYLSLSCYRIDFKPWHNDPYVLGRCAMTFLSHTSYSRYLCRIFWITMWNNVSPLMYMSAEAHEWILASQYKGPLSKATPPACTLWARSTFNPLKYIQYCFNVGPASQRVVQHWTNIGWLIRTFQMLQINIELTVVNAETWHVDAMLF